MRDRERIENDAINGRIKIGKAPFVMPLDLEVLLDIRELLQDQLYFIKVVARI